MTVRPTAEPGASGATLKTPGPFVPPPLPFPLPMSAPSPLRRRSRAAGTILGILLLGVAGDACTKPTEADGPVRLTIVQGNAQIAAVGTLLPIPVVLRVVGASGSPLADVPVQFSVQLGGGSVDPGTATSDANGEVKTKWTLGPTATAHLLMGTARGGDTVGVGATGVPPKDLVVVQGNQQLARAGTLLPTAIILRVTGGANVPIPNQTVTFAVTAGGGSVSPQTAVTNAAGEVTLRWTLGPATGLQGVSATVGALTPLVLAATAN